MKPPGALLELDVDPAASGDDEETDAAKDALGAIARKDAKGLSMALSRHYELCAAKHGESNDESPESTPESSKRY